MILTGLHSTYLKFYLLPEEHVKYICMDIDFCAAKGFAIAALLLKIFKIIWSEKIQA